jgi:hypothetical protein
MKRFAIALIVMTSLLAGLFSLTLFLTPVISLASDKGITDERFREKISKLSIPFIENTGQIVNEEVSFYAKTLEA